MSIKIKPHKNLINTQLKREFLTNLRKKLNQENTQQESL